VERSSGKVFEKAWRVDAAAGFGKRKSYLQGRDMPVNHEGEHIPTLRQCGVMFLCPVHVMLLEFPPPDGQLFLGHGDFGQRRRNP